MEKYKGDNIVDYFRKYEIGYRAKQLGNTQEGDGAKYRGAGAIQFTGRNAYTRFSEYAGDPKILEDGALYVGKEYFGKRQDITGVFINRETGLTLMECVMKWQKQ